MHNVWNSDPFQAANGAGRERARLAGNGLTTAGRAYAAYGSVYIVSSICWLWAVEGARPDRWDVIGAGVALVGAGIIVFGVRS